MDSSKILADFQLVKNRVSKFSIDTNAIMNKEEKAIVNYDIDYNILRNVYEDGKYTGLLEFIVRVNAKIMDDSLFNIIMIMEGVFIGNPNKLSEEQFKNMLELNGVATLSQLSRAYIISMSSISGLNPPVKLPMLNIHDLIYLKN
jgi:preprotein translocase subunit SecB